MCIVILFCTKSHLVASFEVLWSAYVQFSTLWTHKIIVVLITVKKAASCLYTPVWLIWVCCFPYLRATVKVKLLVIISINHLTYVFFSAPQKPAKRGKIIQRTKSDLCFGMFSNSNCALQSSFEVFCLVSIIGMVSVKAWILLDVTPTK